MAACKRMSRGELVELAKKLGIVQFRVKTSDGTRQMKRMKSVKRSKPRKVLELSPTKILPVRTLTLRGVLMEDSRLVVEVVWVKR